ncbi:hypothetical protein ZWY2020_050436 [Hordeum vulgare]|nr:hypothetical protein ZWY2020_050436 [Hordeum vulgare]
MGATTRVPDVTHAIWKALWGCPGPPKVRVFAWPVTTNSLATAVNLKRRNIVVTETCVICGTEREDTFHALCRCPLAQRLWRAMGKIWSMPKLEDIRHTGPEWLLHLLIQCHPDEHLQVLMTLWRSWHMHNELTHGKKAPPIEASTRFLSSYIDTLLCIKQHPSADIAKGNMAVSYLSKPLPDRDGKKQAAGPDMRWSKPPRGWTKLNIDGAFSANQRTGGAGMILRSDDGQIIYSSCRYLRSCSSVLETELAACMEGIIIAREHGIRCQ